MFEFNIVRVLSTIFTPEFNISNSLSIANLATDLVGDRLDGEATMLPLPQDAPPDIPRIILTSSDKLLSISISPKRTNFEFKVPLESIIDKIDYTSYYSGIANFFSEYTEKLDLKVQRLGYVTDRLIIEEDVLSYMLDRFCNKEQTFKGKPFYNAKRFEIHSLKDYEWEGFQINSWVRMKYFPMKAKDSERKPTLYVQNDLNTLPEDEDPGADFSTTEIEKYFSNIPNHLEQILNLYFS